MPAQQDQQPPSQPPRSPEKGKGARSQSRAEARQSRRQAVAAQETRNKQIKLLVGAIAVALVIVVALIALNRPQAVSQTFVAAAPLPATIPLDGMSMGKADAPVKIEEWGDYQCPGCGIFAKEVVPKLIAQYVEPGKVQFTFHDFAFLGKESTRAAEAAACAADQGAYWPYHDALYANQHGENLNAFSDDRLKALAQTLELDTAKFNACLDSGEKAPLVEAANVAAREAGINSTPTMLINGVKLDDWRNWETVSQTIDAAVAE